MEGSRSFAELVLSASEGLRASPEQEGITRTDESRSFAEPVLSEAKGSELALSRKVSLKRKGADPSLRSG